jgi:hypothetical protein
VADLSITDTDVLVDDAVFELGLIAGEDIDAGETMYVNPSTGKWALFNNAIENVQVYIARDTVKSGRVLVGSLEATYNVGAALAALNYGVPVYASSTLGKIATTGPATNEVQTVTITGTPTGGTFTLSFGGQVTGALAYNAAAATIQTALEGLSTIGTGNVLVTGSAGGPWTVTFIGALAGQDLALMVADGALLTGGTTPDATVAETTPGVAPRKLGYVIPIWNTRTGSPNKLLYWNGRE